MRGLLIVFMSIVASSVNAGAIQSKSASANMAPGCNIRLQVPPDARVTSSPENRGSGGITVPNPRHLVSKEYIEPFYVGFACYDVNDSSAQRGWARKDEGNDQWQLNMSTEEQKARSKTVHFYPLKAINATGWAVTVDDTIGEERNRGRRLHYCLIHQPKALCGTGDMGYLS
ncbi:MAG: hypothetical protein M0P19_09960, partial [Nevskia sp.]|nr:hypothetical protein [Nevskia sp.]